MMFNNVKMKNKSNLKKEKWTKEKKDKELKRKRDKIKTKMTIVAMNMKISTASLLLKMMIIANTWVQSSLTY